jgi:hypothetical protein
MDSLTRAVLVLLEAGMSREQILRLASNETAES